MEIAEIERLLAVMENCDGCNLGDLVSYINKYWSTGCLSFSLISWAGPDILDGLDGAAEFVVGAATSCAALVAANPLTSALVVGGILLVVVVGGGIYLYIRHKNKQNNARQTSDEREESKADNRDFEKTNKKKIREEDKYEEDSFQIEESKGYTSVDMNCSLNNYSQTTANFSESCLNKTLKRYKDLRVRNEEIERRKEAISTRDDKLSDKFCENKSKYKYLDSPQKRLLFETPVSKRSLAKSSRLEGQLMGNKKEPKEETKVEYEEIEVVYEEIEEKVEKKVTPEEIRHLSKYSSIYSFTTNDRLIEKEDDSYSIDDEEENIPQVPSPGYFKPNIFIHSNFLAPKLDNGQGLYDPLVTPRDCEEH
ncbi:unnamed protein product [Moneuplotes crassus]|uniref:Uncharacterized protein n=1 Tax=Euplotes crassus TaxID=5936 RepID=A0AAD1USX0_EUPCR|nr:unnamed protein product [Moneuplotes crassus]